MEQVPMDDVKALWNDMPEQSWNGLRRALENRQNKAEGIEDTLVNQMLDWAEQKENSGEPFPATPEELHNMLREGQGSDESSDDEDEGEQEYM